MQSPHTCISNNVESEKNNAPWVIWEFHQTCLLYSLKFQKRLLLHMDGRDIWISVDVYVEDNRWINTLRGMPETMIAHRLTEMTDGICIDAFKNYCVVSSETCEKYWKAKNNKNINIAWQNLHNSFESSSNVLMSVPKGVSGQWCELWRATRRRCYDEIEIVALLFSNGHFKRKNKVRSVTMWPKT